MRLSELLYRAACLKANEAAKDRKRQAKIAKREGAGRDRKTRVNGLVSIPNKIRKRMSGAPR